MKKLGSLLLLLLITLTSFSQNVYRWYQDGKIVFQIKTSEKVIFSDENKEVQLSHFPEIAQYKNTYGIDRIIQLHPGIQDDKLVRTYQIEFTDHQNVDVLVRKLNQLNTFEYVEKKELHETFLTPNDPNFVNQTNNGQWSLFQINAQQAWDISTGSSNIVVAVTDNAIQVNHPDLQNKVVNGRDVVDNDNDPSPCGGNDGFHGSHVSGIVGAETNNGTGIASIGYNVSIMPIKIGNCSTGALSGGYDGIVWAADNNADVVNMSWGGGGQSTYGQNVCNYAWNAGTILVAGAGNDGTSQLFYPAAYNNVISVASTTTNDSKSGFSQYGTWIDISAPGSSILSCDENTGYQVTQGTSMASPLVAGLVGLMKSHAPSAPNQDIVDCLLNSADNIDAQNSNYIGELGSGRINAEQALLCMNQYTYNLDIGISQINAPEGQYCSGSVTPEFVLKNYGSNTVTSATITYEISGQGQQTLNWTGNLTQGDEDIITLPVQSPGPGSYTFNVTASQPNGSSDQYSNNNNKNTNFTTITNGQVTTLTLITDCYGSEIEWTIEDDNSGQIVASGGPYSNVAGGETITQDICLAAGCYTFEITDSYGDGMYGSQWNCNVDGDYNMVDNSGMLFEMTANNADFGNGTTHNFCIASNFALDAGISQITEPGNGICSSSLTPEVQLYNYGTSALTSVTINYEISGGTLQTYNWTGNLAPGTYTSVTLPGVSVTPGNYTFTAYTSMPNGSTDQQPINDEEDAAFTVYASSQPLPFSEDFESANFTNNNWSMINPDGGITWEIATIAGTTPGDKAAKLDFYNYGNGGERDIMQTPPLDFSTQTDIELDFDHAFRRYNTNSADSLILLISTDCGSTFQSLARFAEDGTGSFATATTNTNEFTPVAGEWCMGTVGADCFTIDLSAYDGFTDVIIRFESFNNGIAGNNLFIDNINIEGVPVTSPPTASIGSSTQTTCVGDNVFFNDNSSGAPNSWTWDFGDGNTSTQQNPSHSYTAPGVYDVSLTASNANGTDTETQTGYIVVYDNSSSSQNVEICDGESVTVGSSTYTSAGTYTNVLLNANGCDSTVTTTVVVNPSPNPSIISESTTVCSNSSSMTLNGNPTGGTFSGTGMSGNVFDPAQAGQGPHAITYSVTNGIGCTGTETIQITVEDCLSIDESDEQAITLFPNPNNGQFQLTGVTPGTQFTILNIRGQIISSGSATTDNITVQIPEVEDGIYMIQLTTDETTIVKRFMVKD